jgi:hypothetical protein
MRNIDLKPTPEVMERVLDQRAADERVRVALEDPELRAELARQGRSVEFTPVPPAPASSPKAARPVVVPITSGASAKHAAESAPSPWVKPAPAAAIAIDPASLPSANAPKVRESANDENAAKKPAPVRAAPRPSIWTPMVKAVAAVLAAVVPAIVVAALFVNPPQGKQNGDGIASAKGTSAEPTMRAARAAPPVTATASVQPSAPAAPASATAAPSMSATSSASAAHNAPSVAVPRPKASATDDPYNDAAVKPVPAPTVQPQPVPTQEPKSSPPSPSSTAKLRDPFLLEKQD